ncbi:MAG: hypothetical protein ACREMN_08915 [Gemmatimonadales bacterium]
MPKHGWIVVAALAVLMACGGDSGTGYNGGNPPPPPPPPTGGRSTTVTVSDDKFRPTPDTITNGQTVTFNFTGASAHTVTFEDDIGNSGQQVDGSHTRTFSGITTATTFRYRCTNHSSTFTNGMVAQIVVLP